MKKSSCSKTSGGSLGKLDRKTVEKNRRIHMKGLFFKLTSLIPPQHFQPSKELLSQLDQLDQAATYIKQLKERVEKLKERKTLSMGNFEQANRNSSSDDINDKAVFGFTLPVVEFRDFDSNFEVVMISGLKKNFIVLHEAISVLQDEGAEVVSASFSTIGDKVFHTIHAQVKVSRVGVDTSRVCQRLQELVC